MTALALSKGRLSGCVNADGTAKLLHRTRSHARDAAHRQGARQGVAFSTYLCPQCDGYHVAHRGGTR